VIAPEAPGGFLRRLLVGHAAFNALKVALALACAAFCGVDPAAGALVGKARGGDLNLCANLVLETQIFVDVGRCRLSGGNGPDDGGGSGDAVASGRRVLESASSVPPR